MTFSEQFRLNWEQHFHHLSPINCHIILAVSGGVDSVVMSDLVSKSGFPFSIAHCNFGLREEESDRDERFVKQLGIKYGVEVVVKNFDTMHFAQQHGLGIQEAARKLRYQWFDELLDGMKFTNSIHASVTYRLATAHHEDDNIETVLFNIFRGTGISGLHGILPEHHRIIRPLLFASRPDILDYARTQKLDWVEDASNESTRYTRNYIRLEVLPMLKQIFPAVTTNIGNSIRRWKEAEELYTQALQLHKKKLCTAKGNEMHIPVLRLKKSSPLKTITFEIIKDYGFAPSQLESVLALLESESGKYVESATHRIIRNRNWLIVAPVETLEAENILIEKDTRQVVFSEGILQFETGAGTHFPESNDIAVMDADEIQFPLLLRKWKQGDYFYPLGMRKKKKLSRFLIDQKVSLTGKEKVWVIESNKKIAWVVGYRIDDRFKITPSTRQSTRIRFKNS